MALLSRAAPAPGVTTVAWAKQWQYMSTDATMRLKEYKLIDPRLSGSPNWFAFEQCASTADTQPQLSDDFARLLELVPVLYPCIFCRRPFAQFTASRSLNHWLTKRMGTRLEYLYHARQDVLARRIDDRELTLSDAWASDKVQTWETFKHTFDYRPQGMRQKDVFMAVYGVLAVADYKADMSELLLAFVQCMQRLLPFRIRPKPATTFPQAVTVLSKTAANDDSTTAANFVTQDAAWLWFFGVEDVQQWRATLQAALPVYAKRVLPSDVE